MANTKQLRFAALIRVSTDQQKKQGQSLKTQTKQVTQAVEQLGGTITKWYKGQQHATSGYEHRMVNEMLDTASRKRKAFDAVIVADPTRWSRDNSSSDKGLNILRDNGIRFFALMQEFDLHDPMFRFMLAQYTAFGALQAGMQKQKSMLNKIERAKEGKPTSGSLPFGRTYDRKTGKWGVDAAKKELIVDAAERYLAGESIVNLATEYGIDPSTLHDVLSSRAGKRWTQSFHADDLNIHADIELTVPHLLPDKTIKAIRKQMDRNRTHVRGKNKHQYLLAGFVFCESCGHALSPQHNNGTRYYRPAAACDCLGGHVRADDLEGIVIRQLFETLGNPKEVEKAINAAKPDKDKAKKYQARKANIEAELAKIKRSRAKHMKALDDDLIPEDEVHAKLLDLRERERRLEDQLDRLLEHLGEMPTDEAIRSMSERVSARLATKLRHANHAFEEMDWDAKRELVKSAFCDATVEGWPHGVYVETIPGNEGRRPRPWAYTLRGNMVDNEVGTTTLDPNVFAGDDDYVNEKAGY